MNGQKRLVKRRAVSSFSLPFPKGGNRGTFRKSGTSHLSQISTRF